MDISLNNTSDWQVEEGSTATPYIPHEEQEINFPLEEGQNFYEGDYLADDGVHHKRYQYEMNGVDDDLRVLTVGQYNGIYYCVCLPAKAPKTAAVGVCSHFKFVSFGIEPGKCYTTGANVIFVLEDQTITTKEQANAWLAEQKANGTPVTFQIVVQEEYIDPYTPEQQEVYDQIEALRTHKGGTYIDSSNNVKSTVNLKYVADTKLYIDSKIATLTNS